MIFLRTLQQAIVLLQWLQSSALQRMLSSAVEVVAIHPLQRMLSSALQWLQYSALHSMLSSAVAVVAVQCFVEDATQCFAEDVAQ